MDKRKYSGLILLVIGILIILREFSGEVIVSFFTLFIGISAILVGVSLITKMKKWRWVVIILVAVFILFLIILLSIPLTQTLSG